MDIGENIIKIFPIIYFFLLNLLVMPNKNNYLSYLVSRNSKLEYFARLSFA